MVSHEKIKSIWNRLEGGIAPPKYASKIVNLDFEQLKNILEKSDIHKLEEMIEALYSGVCYIVRGAAGRNLKKIMLSLAERYEENSVSSFHKMLDGTPNFHRVIDNETTKKYSLYAIKHSYYFYNWNIKTDLDREFKEGVYHHWRYIKLLAGNKFDSFENNIPSDLQIDRLQIVNYPLGGGELRSHEDPRKNQRIVSGLIMSKRGEDFQYGGFYFKDSESKNWNIEDRLEVGDAVMFYGSIVHGVEPVDPQLEIDWGSKKGRWFIGMFVNDSDHVSNRTTARDLTGSTNFKREGT